MPKTSHLSLAHSSMLMRDLRAIIRVPVPTMRDRRHDFALRRNVTAELVGRDSHRQLALPFQQLSKEPSGRPRVFSLLNQNVQYIPVLVDRTPKVPSPASDRHDHLIEKPSVSATSKARLDTPSKLRPERRAPLTNRLVRHLDAALGE